MWNGICPFWNAGAYSTWGWLGVALYFLFWIGLIAGVIYLVVRLVRNGGAARLTTHTTYPAYSAESLPAVEIARMRYARGEIDRETYLQLVEDLK